MRIGIVAPSSRLDRSLAERVTALAAASHPGVDLVFHPQCFLAHNHFAGTDRDRAEAFIAFANDPAFDALWVGRGGYGSCRIAAQVIAALGTAARAKAYLGYSDAGFILAGLYKAGFPHLGHGPLVGDVKREGGEGAILRALDWLARRDPAALEPSLARGMPHAAFNITVLSQLLGTALEPDLSGHVLMLEDVSEHLYRTDRALFHLTGNAGIARVAGIRLGRVSDILENDPDFGETAEEIARFWCARANIPYLGRADIGHDADNKVVPFGFF